MEIINAELTADWYTTASIGYVDSVVAEVSDSGVVQPINRQIRPLLQATFGTWDVDLVEAMFGSTRSGRKAFFIRPPIERFRKVTGAVVGLATGASQTFQLYISRGDLAWNALYPVEATIVMAKNGVTISDANWSLGANGVVTLAAGAASSGQTITATFEYLTAVRFVDPELLQGIETADLQIIQSVTIREVF